MKTYYIEISGYADTVLPLPLIHVVKVEANDLEEAVRKATEYYVSDLDFSAVTKQRAEEVAEVNGIDIVEVE